MFHNPPMHEWIRDRLKEVGATQAALAQFLGLAPARIVEIIRGDRRVQPNEAAGLASFLQMTIDDVYARLYGADIVVVDPKGAPVLIEAKTRRSPRLHASDLTQAPVMLPSTNEMPRDLPVLGTAAGSVTGAFQLENVIIDYVRRPPGLAGAADVYAIYVIGESMAPKFEGGDLLFVHPHRPVRTGDFVIIQTRRGEHDGACAYIKRLARRTADKLIVEQINPPATLEFPMAEVVAVHKVLTMNDLFGV